jgi:hypothetical protein
MKLLNEENMMNKNVIEGVKNIIAADKKSNAVLIEGVQQIVEALSKQRSTFLMKKAEIEKDIDSGAKLTDYRISL